MQSVAVLGAILGVLVSKRPEIGMEFGSTKRNRCRKSGLPVNNPLTLFWDCKNSPNLYEMDHNVHLFWHENCLI